MPRFKRRDCVTSLSFSGVDQYVDIGTALDEALAATGEFTIDCFVRPVGTGFMTIISLGGGGTGKVELHITAGQVFGARLTNGSSAESNFDPAGGGINLYQWFKGTLTYSANTATLYKNGTAITTKVYTGITIANGANRIGVRPTANDDFSGLIDEVRIWNRALSGTEVSDLYFSNTVPSSGLLAEYLFNEGSGTTANDTSGNGYTGTITGATYSGDVPMKARLPQRNENAAILANGIDGSAGNALSIPNNASLSPTAAVTLEIWFRPTALKAGILFDNSTVGTTNSYFLSMGADGSINWFSTIGGLSKTIVGTAKKAKFFEWNCVSATYNGSAVLIFLNGSQLAETLAVSGALGTNSGPLRIGAYYSGGISATFLGNLSQPRVYAAGCTLAEHQDRYYRSITSTALQAGLVLDLNTQLGAGSTVTDLSGLGNHATMGASASWTSDSPFKSRKASVNANMVKNGNFEYAPPFTAATTTDSRWIDGTAAGSTTNDLFLFAFSRTGSNGQANFDTSVTRNSASLASMKVSTTGVNTLARARTLRVVDAPNVLAYGIPLSPNTSYTLSGWMKTAYVSGDATTGAFFRVSERTASSTQLATNDTTYIKVTSDWTRYTTTFTTNASTRYGEIQLLVEGNIGTATLVMDAWFEDIVLTPVYPEGRVPANGNLVKNFDFEVVPTFVAATSTAGRWIDGTAAGSTTNATYKWATATAALTATVGASFDTTVFYKGSASLKLEALDATGVIVVANVLNAASGGSLGTIPIAPSTAYTFSAWVKTSTVGSNGAYMDVRQFNAGGGTITTTSSTKLSGTNDWTQVTGSFTSDAAATNVCILFRNTIAGQASTMWVDEVYLAPTTNPGRIAIT